MESLIDAFFNGGAGNKRIIQLEEENKYLKREIARHQAISKSWMDRCADLSRRMGKIKIQLIDLQVKSR